MGTLVLDSFPRLPLRLGRAVAGCVSSDGKRRSHATRSVIESGGKATVLAYGAMLANSVAAEITCFGPDYDYIGNAQVNRLL